MQDQSIIQTEKEPNVAELTLLSEQSVKKKKDSKAKPETFLQPDLLLKTFNAPQELDLFVLETKSRKIIQELMQPILDDMNEDRKLLLGLKVH